MSATHPTSVISYWNHMVPDMQQSSNEFYAAVDRVLQDQHLDDAKVERVNFSEGAVLFSSKREYLQVRRKEHVVHVCAAPYGSGFFVSWWLGEIESGLFAELLRIPFLGAFLGFLRSVTKPYTYYRIDTALMFQSATHGAVLEVLEGILDAKGLRGLSDMDRKPVMRDFWSRL